MVARLVRSAVICCSMAASTRGGGSMDFSSTRVTRMPQVPVASSRTPRSCLLMESRLVWVCSRSREPIRLRSVVAVSCSMAWMKFATS